jgi:hypothetical protein
MESLELNDNEPTLSLDVQETTYAPSKKKGRKNKQKSKKQSIADIQESSPEYSDKKDDEIEASPELSFNDEYKLAETESNVQPNLVQEKTTNQVSNECEGFVEASNIQNEIIDCEAPVLEESESIVYNGWDMYQLGKAITLGIDNIDSPLEIGKTTYKSERERYYEQFPDSLVTAYCKVLEKYNNDGDDSTYQPNIAILCGLINGSTDPSLRPSVATIVVHLTLGNVLKQSDSRYGRKLGKDEILENGVKVNDEVYLRPADDYLNTIELLRKRAVSKGIYPKVVIFAGTSMSNEHYNRIGLEKDDLSSEILKEYKSCIEKLGLSCEVRAGGDPDWDFVYMCKASAFIGSGGYYSGLIRKCRSFMTQMTSNPNNSQTRRRGRMGLVQI